MIKSKTAKKNSETAARPQPAARLVVVERRKSPALFYCLSLFLIPFLAGAAQAFDSSPYFFNPNRASVDPAQPCLRAGRCDFESYNDRARFQRLDRMAPQASPGPQHEPSAPRVIEPTPAENLQPAYRQSGTVREEYAASGSAR